ncbi:MAG: hypothetical protein JSR18_02970 [Proteobacteria bacterium]|nr:hypothetical protein [Pseudomonadota bacterium]
MSLPPMLKTMTRCGLAAACLMGATATLAQTDAAPRSVVLAQAPAAQPVPEPAPAAPAPASDWKLPDPITVEWLASHPNPFIAPGSVNTPLEQRAWLNCEAMWQWAGRQCQGLKAAWFQGRATWFFSGYAWHIPGTWTEERLAELNSQAWGGGYGFARTDEHGDNYIWFSLFFKDSHSNLQSQVGWAWLTYWPAVADVSVGLGYAAFILQRPDIANGWPVPAALPIASVKVYQAELLATYIPKLNGGINHGDVMYFFARYQF